MSTVTSRSSNCLPCWSPVDIGWTVVRLEDQIFTTQVTFAEENEPSLLGVVTLEDALLAVDPVGQRLVPVEAERL